MDKIQYSVNGKASDPIQHILFKDDHTVYFPEIDTFMKLSEEPSDLNIQFFVSQFGKCFQDEYVDAFSSIFGNECKSAETEMTRKLQRLSVEAGNGFEFTDGISNCTVIFTLAGLGKMQYSIDGRPCDPITRFNVRKHNCVHFQENLLTMKFPDPQSGELMQKFRSLAIKAEIFDFCH